MGCMFATDAKTQARSNSRDCQEREAAPPELFCPRSGAHARNNCEEPPLAISAECARICIDGCEICSPGNGKARNPRQTQTPGDTERLPGLKSGLAWKQQGRGAFPSPRFDDAGNDGDQAWTKDALQDLHTLRWAGTVTGSASTSLQD